MYYFFTFCSAFIWASSLLASMSNLIFSISKSSFFFCWISLSSLAFSSSGFLLLAAGTDFGGPCKKCYTVKSRFKEWQGADGGHSVNQETLLYVQTERG